MRHPFLLFFAGLALAVTMVDTSAAQWKCVYATYDDDTNGTGHNTTSVGVISENMFVALVMTPNTRNFMLPYVNADSATGRVNFVGYGSGVTSGKYHLWTDGLFDQTLMSNAAKIVATPDSLIYVANNDVDHNILVFKFANDTIQAAPPFLRQATGTNRIYGVTVDANGYVYVCNDTTTGKTDDIKIFNPVNQWTMSHTDSPVRTIDLPDGVYRGITVSPDGHQLFVSDYGNKKVLRYTGSTAAGYTADGAFNFTVTDSIPSSADHPGPIGLAYLASKGIVAVAVDFHTFSAGSAHYDFGRIYLLNSITGQLVSTDSSVSVIDIAKWNFTATGVYNNRVGGTVPGNASGYASVYDVAFDGNGNLYTQSHFGWTVEKWAYTGTLPVVSSIERTSSTLPEVFRLSQNYPNPFNPTTVIEFAILKSSHVSLNVYDVLGREVEVLVNAPMEVGTYTVNFDANHLPGGVYFYTLQSNGFNVTRKMLLVK